jgi:hypothetical protein
MKRCAQCYGSCDQVSAPVICGTAAGGFTFAFVRPVAKLFMSWGDTTPTHIAGAASSLAPIRKADCVRRFRALVLKAAPLDRTWQIQ